MPAIVVLAAAGVAAGISALGWVVMTFRAGSRRAVLSNAVSGLGPGEDRPALRAPRRSGVRLSRPPLSTATRTRIERLIATAGRPAGWPLHRVIIGKFVLPLAAGALGALFVAAAPSAGRILLVAVVVIVCHFVPDLLLLSKAQERQAAIAVALPDTLDQMTIAVEAGLGFEAAMQRTARNSTGPLADELTRTLQDMQLGQVRRDAYLALAERTGVPDLRRFLRAVIRADSYGVPIAEVLRTQAGEMRIKRRQRAEEKAMKIPVKVIFPLMMCILPALFIVLLGPVVIEVMHTFSRP